MKNDKKPALFKLPQVDLILNQATIEQLVKNENVDRTVLAKLTREVLQDRRQFLQQSSNSNLNEEESTPESIANQVERKWRQLSKNRMNRVINATGVILNTNLGRAPLSKAIADEVTRLITGYCNLEYDLNKGERSHRTKNVSRLIQILTGAQDALVVNNNAAAVMLAICALAQGKEVIVSRSELIEIGGSFRLPDVIVASGAVLKEVGTTNKTRLEDFSQAISTDTACILKCHQSNFKIIGFTDETKAEELSRLSREKNIPFIHDLGSGSLINIDQFGLEHEPTVQECIEEGADLVLFSGDKLLGGGQAGIIAGRKDLIEKLASHPIYRTLRLDKLNIALLETVLLSYLKTDICDSMPALKMAKDKVDEVKKRAEKFVQSISKESKAKLKIEPISTNSTFGGGSLPGQTLASHGLALTTTGDFGSSRLVKYLRQWKTPIIALVQKDQVILDFRTILPEDEAELLSAINNFSCYSSGYNKQD
ncbi:MAG: L-seryl-tRNA(Sec) selenium transferase [Candidatus Melainabacteria bacterium]|nr:L-seryl-tRNA(Sec) selenium transferase [Candidatus Melainabacteria bacterium]